MSIRYSRKSFEEYIVTEPGSHEDERLSTSSDWVRVPGEPFGDPLDIRDPRNVDETSPIEGATHESLGVADAEPDAARTTGAEDDTDETDEEGVHEEPDSSRAVQSGDQVTVSKEKPGDEYDLRHG
jgi:hypothetical protein